mgnify:CR=1 FL=1
MVQDISDIITDVSVTADVTLVTVYNLPNKTEIIAKLFEALAEEGVNVDMISLTPSQLLKEPPSFCSLTNQSPRPEVSSSRLPNQPSSRTKVSTPVPSILEMILRSF